MAACHLHGRIRLKKILGKHSWRNGKREKVESTWSTVLLSKQMLNLLSSSDCPFSEVLVVPEAGEGRCFLLPSLNKVDNINIIRRR